MKKTILIGLAVTLPGLLFAGVSLPTPVHHWTFDTDGTDSVGGNTMLFTGTSSHDPNCGRYGGGGIKLDSTLSADGAASSSPVDFGAFANGDQRTISYWVKGNGVSQENNATMVGLGLNATGARFDIKFNGPLFRVEIQGTGQNTTYNTLNDGFWHHLAVVIPVDPGTMSDMIFYIDGVVVTNASGSSLAVNTATAVVQLGDSANAAADRNFDGWMDDVRIYDVGLDAGQIGQVIAEADAGGANATCFATDDDDIIFGSSANLSWDAFALGASTLTITNDQDASVIDAKALTTGTAGATSVSPTDTTIYSLNIDGSPVASATINVKTTPDLLTFTASPDFFFGSGSSTLDWTTAQAMRLEISNDQNATVLTYTTTVDTQGVLDAGSVVVGPISTTTVYTLSGWLDEPGAGTAATLLATVTIQPGPDLDIVASPSVFAGPQDVTLHFNATVIITATEFATGTFDGFADDIGTTGFDLQDSLADFDAALGVSTAGIYSVERLNGDNAGAFTDVLSWNGTNIEVADDIIADLSWNPADYRIVTIATSGADMLVINDGSTDIFTTTDPAVIANGSFLVSGVNADTTFTATASISGAGSTMAAATVDADGTGTTYEEVILADGPIGYFPFNESATGTTIYDYSGNANHSTEIIGSLIQGETGAIGTAHRFSNNETITVGVTLDPSDPDADGSGALDADLTEGFTMEALINPTTAAGNNKHIWANGDGTGTGRSALFLSAAGGVNTFLGNATTASAARPLDSSWCHLAMTVSYNSGTDLYEARTYLDGNLVDTLELTNAPEPSDGLWRIGSHKARAADGFWDGLLDEVAVYDYALTDVQIAAHNAAFISNAVGLLAFERSARVLRNEPYDLYVKVGGASSSAFIDNGGGIITPGTAGNVTVTPSADTTYTLDVDGVTKSVTLQVLDPIVVTNTGTDNGGGFPFVEVDGITSGIYYQLFTSTNLQIWTVNGPPFLGVGTTNTFVDAVPFDNVAQPERFYQVRDVIDPAP